jgi:type III secretory pathway component EscR
MKVYKSLIKSMTKNHDMKFFRAKKCKKISSETKNEIPKNSMNYLLILLNKKLE